MSLLVAIATASTSSAESLNTDHSVELTCGIVYSVGSHRAHGGWPNFILNNTGDPQRTHIMHLHYAPFVRVHNPGSSIIRYDFADSGPPKVVFNTPPLALQFQRLSGASIGYMSTAARPLKNLYVFAEHTSSLFKVFRISLQGDLAATELELQPGETRVFVSYIPDTWTWALDRPADGTIIYDWRNDKTGGIVGISTHGWRGPAYAYSTDWLGGTQANATTANSGLGVIATRPEDTWNMAIAMASNSLAGTRVYKIPTTPSSNWPMEPAPSLEITSFPQQSQNLIGTFSTSDVFIPDDTEIQSRIMNPVFSTIVPHFQTTHLRVYRDTDADGLDDTWERVHFGNLLKDGTVDTDGDGQNDEKEFLTGSSPIDGNDILLSTLRWEGGNLIISWPVIAARRYDVQESTDLKHWETIRTVGSLHGYLSPLYSRSETITPIDNTNKFYRIKVRHWDSTP